MCHKLKRTHSDIEKALKECHKAFNISLITYEMLLHALKIASKYKYSFPDSLIISTALDSDCNILFSEDMHNDQIIGNTLKIINPFLQDLYAQQAEHRCPQNRIHYVYIHNCCLF